VPVKLRNARSHASVFAVAFLFLCTVIPLAAQRIPYGTTIVVRNDTAFSSATARIGRSWTGSMVNDLSVRGRVIARAGTPVRGRIADAESSGRHSGAGAYFGQRHSGADGHVRSGWSGPHQKQRRQDWRRGRSRRSAGRHLRRRQRRSHWRGGRSRRRNGGCRSDRKERSEDPCRIDSDFSGSQATVEDAANNPTQATYFVSGH
jgi:hypothetical protein